MNVLSSPSGLRSWMTAASPLLLELLKPLVPADVLELLLACAAREVEAQDAGVVAVAGAADARGLAAVLLGPAPDLVAVGRDGLLTASHEGPPAGR
jgi:hypothetical protein